MLNLCVVLDLVDLSRLRLLMNRRLLARLRRAIGLLVAVFLVFRLKPYVILELLLLWTRVFSGERGPLLPSLVVKRA